MFKSTRRRYCTLKKITLVKICVKKYYEGNSNKQLCLLIL
jgi:hypothetical protein